jgi:hypothetical protein
MVLKEKITPTAKHNGKENHRSVAKYDSITRYFQQTQPVLCQNWLDQIGNSDNGWHVAIQLILGLLKA